MHIILIVPHLLLSTWFLLGRKVASWHPLWCNQNMSSTLYEDYQAENKIQEKISMITVISQQVNMLVVLFPTLLSFNGSFITFIMYLWQSSSLLFSSDLFLLVCHSWSTHMFTQHRHKLTEPPGMIQFP